MAGARLREGTEGGERSGTPTAPPHGLLRAGATAEMGTQEEEQVGGTHVGSAHTLKSS